MRELFIYYRLRACDAVAARAAVLRFQAQLRMRDRHLVARLLCRSDEGVELQTWMETYAIDPVQATTGIDLTMQAEIEALACVLQPWLHGPRHIEAFVACTA
ncbi:MAG: DUF4936 family protein [Burkholderiaceae bacterium]